MLKGKGAEIVKASVEKKTRLPWWPSGCDAVLPSQSLIPGPGSRVLNAMQ